MQHSLRGVKVSFTDSQFLHGIIAEPLIIGMDFLCDYKAILNLDTGILMLNRHSLRLNNFKTSDGKLYSLVPVSAHEKLNIPLSSVLRTSARLAKTLSGDIVISSSGENKGALLPNTVPIQLVSDPSIPIFIHVGHVLGYAMECDAVLSDIPIKAHTCNLDQLPTNLTDHLEGLLQCSKQFLNDGQAENLVSTTEVSRHVFKRKS